MGRAPCCTKIGLHRGPWTAREDALLIKYIEAHGEGQWRSLPKKAGLLRCGKSCRLRWMNYLRPDIKRGNITPEEDDLIIRLHALLGNRWSLIAGRLPGRTDNEIKNYWNTHLSKRVQTQGSEPNKASEPGSGKRANGSSSNKKRPRSSIMNYNNKRAATQKLHQQKIMDVKDNNVDNVTEKTKTRLPIRPGRVESSMVSLTRNSSNRSLETNVSSKSTNTMSTSASSSQSQSQSQGLNHEVFDPDSIIMDIPWLSHNYNVEENGFDYMMKMGLCGDNNHVNLDIIQPNQDYNRTDFSHPQDNNNRQYEKLYEEYLQLIKVDHGHGLLTGADLDVDDRDDTLDSLTESFLL